MRAKTMSILAIILLMAAIAACGRNDADGRENVNATAPPSPTAKPGTAVPAETPGTAASTEAPPTTDAGGEGLTRTVMTVNGEVTIPAEPQRIVATYYIGELAALGVKPVGTITRQLGAANPNLAAYTEGMSDIGATPNLEAIAALNPDLIIATDFDEIGYEQYAKIAPTVVIPWSDDDVWSKLRAISKMLGKEDEAEAAIRGYESKAEEARAVIEGHVDPNEIVSILMFNGKKIGVFGARDVGYALYDALRLKPPAKVKEMMDKDPAFSSDWTVSMETIPDFAADRMFVAVYNEDGGGTYDELKKLAVWRNLPAVKNGKVYEIPADKWFTYDPISVQATLDDAVRLLTKQPSTQQ